MLAGNEEVILDLMDVKDGKGLWGKVPCPSSLVKMWEGLGEFYDMEKGSLKIGAEILWVTSLKAHDARFPPPRGCVA
jgi:hypothetical protein